MSACHAYMICTSPRSGSTLLCRMLQDTRVAGYPDSHFHRPDRAAWLSSFGLDPETYASAAEARAAAFQAAMLCGKGQGGPFGLRMQRGSFDYFRSELAVICPTEKTDLGRLNAVFGAMRFIHLTRPDKLDQAISRLKAEQTGLWHRSADGTELERASPPAPPHYDRAAITAHIAELTALDDAWNQWFASERISPLRVSYDALAQDPGTVLRQVLNHLGLNADASLSVTPSVAKLADATSKDWRARFRAGS